MRADVFVRRLIERIGLRRHRLFVATPEAAERLQSLSRLSELAAAWTRREPRGSVRDFVRHLTAVADAGELDPDDAATAPAGSVVLAEPEQVKGLEFEHVYVLGLHRGALPARDSAAGWLPRSLLPVGPAAEGEDATRAARARLAYLSMTRASRALVLSWPEQTADGQVAPSPFYEAARDALEAEEEIHEEELFGPAEGLHSTYRMLRDEVLESSWRAGSALSEMRLDTAEDVTQAVARYLELIKLAALVQHPGTEPAAETMPALNELLGAPPPRNSGRRSRRRRSTSTWWPRSATRPPAASWSAARREPSLEQFIPRRGDGLALSASDIDLYRTCPLKYKFARVFAIPQGADDQPALRDPHPPGPGALPQRGHARERARRPASPPGLGRRPGSLDRLLFLFEAGWRRTGFGSSDDELQYRDRAVAALARYHERERSAAVPARVARARLLVRDRRPPAARPGRPGRPARRRRLRAHRLQDRRAADRPGRRRPARPLPPRRLARPGRSRPTPAATGTSWPTSGSRCLRRPTTRSGSSGRCWRSAPASRARTSSRARRTRSASWCDYRLICPASEA